MLTCYMSMCAVHTRIPLVQVFHCVSVVPCKFVCLSDFSNQNGVYVHTHLRYVCTYVPNTHLHMGVTV